jgi:hypothetical protein
MLGASQLFGAEALEGTYINISPYSINYTILNITCYEVTS